MVRAGVVFGYYWDWGGFRIGVWLGLVNVRAGGDLE